MSAGAATSGPSCPLASVVIPHFNDLEGLAKCLASLRRQALPRDLFEVIVADNNSVAGVSAVRDLAPDATVLAAPIQGAGPARNAGAAAARGKVLAFIDCDCIADADWLREGLSALERFDYVGGQVMAETDGRPTTPAEAFELVFAYDFRKFVEKHRFSGTANLFVPSEIFWKVGEFRNAVSEDVDWCWRANGMGFQLGYADRAIVRHAARREWSELKQKWDRATREAFLLARERPGWRLRWLLNAVLVAGSPLAHWTAVVGSPRLVGVRAKWCGVTGLFCIRLYRSYRMMQLLFRSQW
jgi:glycosyltransferase involved in cell wall biosynthesis